MADNPSDANTSAVWQGMAPFIKAAFTLNQSNQPQTAALTKASQTAGKMQAPGSHASAALNTPGGMGLGPMVMPQQGALPNTLPATLQAGVPGPLSMPTGTPQTPLTQTSGTTPTGVPTQINHFITGTPNPLGTQSIS